ncbi:phosphatidate cytidylyltransferase [Thiocystis violacea]|uniref:phosphatidate cytidylyltransferase n=1 Tax=Thiocystis violacea TaxID=13725 RepID=UPI0019087D79|nr:phosphatidate cytidylyltransferase [Thiocystis violacea]MBK1720926.1 phosphatidate cytidylyltransferase [Thiocystis violacea]
MREASLVLASSSLRRRAITAFSLGPLVIAAVLLLPTPGFALFLSVVLLIAAWEWCGLSGITRVVHRIAYSGVVAVCLAILWLAPDWQLALMAVSAIWWFAQAVRLMRTREVSVVVEPRPWQLLVGLLVLLAPWAALMSLHRMPAIGPGLVLFLLVLIWTADSLAYFVGKRWGRAKLAPAVSPGKTRVGVYGALAGAGLCGLLFSWVLSLDLPHTLLALMVCGVAALISVVGDLYESLLKRQRNLKDSSQLLPGHGGLLDRIDSLTAAAPVFALGMAWALT